MAEPAYSEKLARFCLGIRSDQLPDEITGAAKLHILDSLGCLLAGARLEPGRRAYPLAIAASGGAGNSTLFGSGLRAGYLDAVQAMATAAHCGELDDIHGGSGACIGGMIIPALIALAERHGGSGKRFIEAAVAGYETIARVGLAIDAPQLFARGWWPSTICGGFGVAAAGARLLDWPVESIVNALGIASLHAGGMLTGGQEGATARHLAFGRAAQSGVAALLATEHGLTGPKLAFEDPRGFCATLAAAPRWEFLRKFDKFYLPEVAFKPYPCARQLHAGVEALLNVIEKYSVAPSEVAAVELSLPSQSAAMVNRPATPTLRAATLGSGQYVMAVTALRGKIDLQSFEDEFLRSERVHALMAKITVSRDAELDRHFPKYWSGRVTVKLAGGQAHSEQIMAPKGESENPMTIKDVEEKFRGLAAPVIGEEKARDAISCVNSLDRRESLVDLLDGIRILAPVSGES